MTNDLDEHAQTILGKIDAAKTLAYRAKESGDKDLMLDATDRLRDLHAELVELAEETTDPEAWLVSLLAEPPVVDVANEWCLDDVNDWSAPDDHAGELIGNRPRATMADVENWDRKFGTM